MTIVMIDSSAWLELIHGTELGLSVEKFLNKHKCITPATVVAEVCSKARRTGDFEENAFTAMSTVEIVPLTAEIARNAGVLHAQLHAKNSKFGIIDATVLSTARKFNSKILTKDSDFRVFPEVILLKQ